jgi:hypothetical protein
MATDIDAAVAEASATRWRTAALVVVLLVGGYVARSVVADGSDSPLLSWLPWNRSESVTFFFGDAGADRLVPVSRDVGRSDSDPESLVALYLAGPAADSGLIGLIEADAPARVGFTDGALTVDLPAGAIEPTDLIASEAVYQTMRSWPEVTEVTISVGGVLLETNTTGHLLYFYDEDRDMLVAEVTNRVRAGDVLEAYLEGPSADGLIGLPAAVRSTSVELGSNELLTLRFTFPDELRTFALDHPDGVRRVLEGLIATFNTGFPDVGGVLLDFEGHNALGLGQCANLLNTVQQMPEVLNDERLLARYSA